MYYPPYNPPYYNGGTAMNAALQTPQTQAQASNNGLLWVQGEAGAKSYFVAPNSTVMLMDSEADRFFLKSADPSGMPLPLRVFEYVERTGTDTAKTNAETAKPNQDNFVTRDEFNALKAEIDGMRTKKTTKPKEETDNG